MFGIDFKTLYLDTVIAGNSPAAWCIALLAFFVIWFALDLLRGNVARRIRRLAGREQRFQYLHMFGEVLAGTHSWLVILLSLLIASKLVILTPKTDALISSIVIVAVIIQSTLWANAGINDWIRNIRRKHLTTDPSRVTIIAAIGFIGKLMLLVVAILVGLQNIGVQVTGLLASVGVVGIAIGLALQNILGDLFASLSIVLDRPFVLGDFIIVDDKMGVVENIGLKTTRIRSLGGEQIVMGNNDLLQSRIRNFKQMQERRNNFKFGVPYQTTHDQLQSIPATIRRIIEEVPSEQMEKWGTLHEGFEQPLAGAKLTRFDRAHFAGFGESSLDFDVVYYVLYADYNLYMDIQQHINLELFRRFAEQGIEFAYPTRTLHIEQPPPPEKESRTSHHAA